MREPKLRIYGPPIQRPPEISCSGAARAPSREGSPHYPAVLDLLFLFVQGLISKKQVPGGPGAGRPLPGFGAALLDSWARGFVSRAAVRVS